MGKSKIEKSVLALLKHRSKFGKEPNSRKPLSEPIRTLLKINGVWHADQKTLMSQIAAEKIIFQIGDPAKEILKKTSHDGEIGSVSQELLTNWIHLELK